MKEIISVSGGLMAGAAALITAWHTVMKDEGGTTQTTVQPQTCRKHDGTYAGERGYDNPIGGCPARTTFRVTVQSCDVRFNSDVDWSGPIDTAGTVNLTGQSRTGKRLTINGPFSKAIMVSGHCGAGYFRMSKQ